MKKKKVFIQAKTELFFSMSPHFRDQFSSPIPLGWGGLFSFLLQKSASKVKKTGYFAYFSGQWGSDSRSKRTADDVKAVVQRGCLQMSLRFARTGYQCLVIFFFPLNNYHKYTTHSIYYLNREKQRKFLDYRRSQPKEFGKP